MTIWVAYKLDPALSPLRPASLTPAAAARMSYDALARRDR